MATLPALATEDLVAIAGFFAITFGYHGYYAYMTRRHPLDTVMGKVHLYRRTWIKRVIDKENHTMAVQAIRNLLMTSSFMASSSLLVMAVILQYRLGQGSDPLFTIKLDLLVGIFAFAFLSFLFGIRYLNQLSILVGADPDLIGHVEPVDAVTYLSNLLNRANNRFTYGQRAFYFSVPAIAWVVSPYWMIALEVALLVYLAAFVDFRRWKHPLDVQQQTKESRTTTDTPPAASSSPPASEAERRGS